MPDDHKELKDRLRDLKREAENEWGLLGNTRANTLHEAADLIESLEEERDEAVDLLEVERKEPSSIAKSEEFAAGFEAGKAEVDPCEGGGDLREAVTELQAAIFVGGPPPTEQEKALNRVAEVAESLARKADRNAAVLEALTSEGTGPVVLKAVALDHLIDIMDGDINQPDLKSPCIWCDEIRAALQHAQEQVGGEDG